MRNFAFLLLRLTGIPFVLRHVLQRRCVSILCYHDPALAVFERHLNVLERLYNIIPLRRYLEWRRDGDSRLPTRSLVLTFDDGHRGNHALREVIARHHVPVTIFLCSAIVDTSRHFWWKEVAAQKRETLKVVSDATRITELAGVGFDETREYPERQSLLQRELDELHPLADFQSHTRFHPILPQCPADRAAEEIAESKIELEQRLGTSVYALAYPNGDYTEREVELTRRSGYECALTIQGGYNTRSTDLFRLHRIRVSDTAGISELIVKDSGLWSVWERWMMHSHAGRSSAVEVNKHAEPTTQIN